MVCDQFQPNPFKKHVCKNCQGARDEHGAFAAISNKVKDKQFEEEKLAELKRQAEERKEREKQERAEKGICENFDPHMFKKTTCKVCGFFDNEHAQEVESEYDKEMKKVEERKAQEKEEEKKIEEEKMQKEKERKERKMMGICDNFAPHVLKPNICKFCRAEKEEHEIEEPKEEDEEEVQKMLREKEKKIQEEKEKELEEKKKEEEEKKKKEEEKKKKEEEKKTQNQKEKTKEKSKPVIPKPSMSKPIPRPSLKPAPPLSQNPAPSPSMPPPSSSQPEQNGEGKEEEKMKKTRPKRQMKKLSFALNTSGGGEKKKEEEVSAERQKEIWREYMAGVGGSSEDMVDLMVLNNDTMLENLEVRHVNHRAYTYIGNILVSVNPYQRYPIYHSFVAKRYVGKLIGDNPPHLFAIAEHSYSSMMNGIVLLREYDAKAERIEQQKKERAEQERQLEEEKKKKKFKYQLNLQLTEVETFAEDEEPPNPNKSIIISGESGAGKTEANKIILQFLSDRTASQTSIQEKILESSPILEAFGNAKTVNNDNSSRFGKFIEIHFNDMGKIIGANLVTYLLEKTRVTLQNPDERNFHIFYQLCACSDSALKERLHLGNASDFRYLNQSGCTEISGVNDGEEFLEVKKALTHLNISGGRLDGIFNILGGILHLGNIEFSSTGVGDQCDVSDINTLNTAGKILGINNELLRKLLTSKSMITRGEEFVMHLKLVESQSARDSLAMTIYNKLFGWLVESINGLLNMHRESRAMIGILDIFGFENFKDNSFEQLNINFANEKLQQQFNFFIFKQEQEEYEKEEIEWSSVSFSDNSGCIDLIESVKPPGIMCLLNAELKFPQSNDNTFFEKLVKAHKSNNHFGVDARSKTQFSVKHYASNVTYNIEGFMEKNTDATREDFVEMMSRSMDPLIRTLFTHEISVATPTPRKSARGSARGEGSGVKAKLAFLAKQKERKKEPAKGRGKSGKSPPKTVATVFGQQLDSLIKAIQDTEPSYIRCLKPNWVKKPEIFDPELVLKQLQSAGMMETVRIRSEGYLIRYPIDEFERRYKSVGLAFTTIYDTPENPTSDPGWKPPPLEQKACVNGLLEYGLSQAPKDDVPPYQFGKTKVFLRWKFHTLLEQLRHKSIESQVLKIQKVYRGYRIRAHWQYLIEQYKICQGAIKAYADFRKYQKMKKSAIVLQSWWRMVPEKRRYPALRDAERMRRAEDEEKRALLVQQELLRKQQEQQFQQQQLQQQQSLQQPQLQQQQQPQQLLPPQQLQQQPTPQQAQQQPLPPQQPFQPQQPQQFMPQQPQQQFMPPQAAGTAYPFAFPFPFPSPPGEEGTVREEELRGAVTFVAQFVSASQILLKALGEKTTIVESVQKELQEKENKNSNEEMKKNYLEMEEKFSSLQNEFTSMKAELKETKANRDEIFTEMQLLKAQMSLGPSSSCSSSFSSPSPSSPSPVHPNEPYEEEETKQEKESDPPLSASLTNLLAPEETFPISSPEPVSLPHHSPPPPPPSHEETNVKPPSPPPSPHEELNECDSPPPPPESPSPPEEEPSPQGEPSPSPPPSPHIPEENDSSPPPPEAPSPPQEENDSPSPPPSPSPLEEGEAPPLEELSPIEPPSPPGPPPM